MRHGKVATLAALVVALAPAACSGADNGGPGPDRPAVPSAITELAAAWSARDVTAFGAATDDPAAARAAWKRMDTELQTTTVQVTPSGDARCDDAGCRQDLDVSTALAGIGTWTYTTSVATGPGPDALVHWRPSVLHPELRPGTALDRTRELPVRAPIQDRAGRNLVVDRPVYVIGVVPGKATPRSYPRLAMLLHIDGAALRARAAAADPGQFVGVITLRAADYAPMRNALLAIPGVLVDSSTLPLAKSAGWARAVLGTVATATKETLRTAGPLALPTDPVGSSGLEAAYQTDLAGTPGGTVRIVDASSGAPVGGRSGVLWRVPPQPGTALQTTLDERFQDAAEQAVALQTKTTALVAVDARTGEVLAAANGPEVTSLNTAFVGQYPPGSTFKVVASEALIAAGQRITARVSCPSTTVVDGKRFKNYDYISLPAGSTYADAIAASCNTTVVGLSSRLSDSALHDAATRYFGASADWDLPVPAFSGSVPVNTSPVDKAASAIGQGRVLMSPLGMALLAAAVDTGQAHAPSIIAGHGGQVAGNPLPRPVDRDLRTIMRLVVTQGTATSLRGVPGDVGAKTGTAEYGTTVPPRTHGWLIGYRGDVAFACLVVGGSGGNSAAGPVVRRFLDLAPPSVD